RADRRNPADRHRQEERDSDDRFCIGGRKAGQQNIGRGDFPGMHSALSPDSDDHHGGALRRASFGPGDWNGFGIEAAAGCDDHRRADREPDVDAVYDAGGLSLSGSLAFAMGQPAYQVLRADARSESRMSGHLKRLTKSVSHNSKDRSLHIYTSPKYRLVTVTLITALIFSGCTVGPKYQKPAAQAPQAYKELTPADFSKTDGWKVAQPQDAVLHGKWWELFNDPQLNALEEQVNISNQNIKSAAASYFAARALVKQARAQYYPTVSVGPSITTSRAGAAASTVITSGTSTFFEMPFDATWVPDLWGRVRNTVRAQASAAQASEADLENVRLTAQAEVAVDYYSLRGQDDLKQLLDSTVIAFQESLNLTKALYDTGIDSDESVAQAETQLE